METGSKWPWLLIILFSLALRAQVTTTPNIGMQIPPYGSNNWNVPLNYNFTQLDLLLSGNAVLPGLSVSGYAIMPGLTTWKNTTPYATGNVVFYQGIAYTSLTSGNQGNTPTPGTYWSATFGGGSLPVTTLVIKGNDSGGGVAATPNTDYLTPTYWSTLSGCTTASYTYIPQSNTCQPSGGASTPATNGLLKGNGFTNGVVVATAGTDYMAGVPEAAYGYVPVSTGSGNAYTAQQAVLSFGSSFDQYAQQQTNNANYTTLRVNNLNDIFWVDGFKAYKGIGESQIAWSSGPDLDFCRAASYGGNNYIAISVGNGATTPGTNLAIWQPVPNNGPTTMWDCAFYTAAAYTDTQSLQTYLMAGSGFYTTQGMIEPQGLYAVNIFGTGIFGTVLTYTGAAAVAMLSRPDGGNNDTYLQVKNLLMDAGFVSTACMELGQLNQSYIDEIQCQDIVASAPGSGGHFFEFGFSPGDGFQMHASNLTTSGPSQVNGNTALVTANVVGGSITSYTVTNGGSGYPTASTYQVYTVGVYGYKGGTATQPCTVMPVGQVVTVVSGAVTAASEGSNGGGSGCSGTIDVQVFTVYPADYSIIWNSSDSTGDDLTLYQCSLACLIVNAGNNVFHHVHPSVVPNGIINNGNNTYEGTELDATFHYGFIFNQPYSGQSTSVYGTNAYIGGRVLPGSAPYYFGATTTNVVFGPQGALQNGTVPADWHEFVTQTGTVDTPAEYLSNATMSTNAVHGNDVTAGAALGDYSPRMTIGTLTVGTCVNCFGGGTPIVAAPGASQTILNTGAQALNLQALTAATSGANQNSPSFNLNANYWTGSASATCSWNTQVTEGSGPNPSSQWALLPSSCGSGSTILAFTAGAINFTGTTSFFNQLTSFGSLVFTGSNNSINGSTGIPGFNEYIVTGASPTITGCGTISAQHGGTAAGDFTTSTTGACAAAFALPTAPHGYHCSVQDITQHVATNIMIQSVTSTTGCTVTGTTVASDVLTFNATPY